MDCGASGDDAVERERSWRGGGVCGGQRRAAWSAGRGVLQRRQRRELWRWLLKLWRRQLRERMRWLLRERLRSLLRERLRWLLRERLRRSERHTHWWRRTHRWWHPPTWRCRGRTIRKMGVGWGAGGGRCERRCTWRRVRAGWHWPTVWWRSPPALAARTAARTAIIASEVSGSGRSMHAVGSRRDITGGGSVSSAQLRFHLLRTCCCFRSLPACILSAFTRRV